MCEVIPGCSGGHVKYIAVKGEIATTSFKIPATRALYRIFVFREHWLILKSSTCLSVLVQSRNTERSRSENTERVRSYATMSVSSPEVLNPEDIPGAILAEPYTKYTTAALHWWLLCRGNKVPSSFKKQQLVDT